MSKKITVYNWFNTTDISVYQAARSSDGTWKHFEKPRIDIKGDQNQTIDIEFDGIYLTYWPITTIEKPFGYFLYYDGLQDLDVFDIRAGNMPWGFYASWRGAHIPA